MEIQEKAFEKKARSSGSFQKHGINETLAIKTDRYYFKVYHKGAEFRKNDYKELSKKNRNSYDLKKMLQIADRTLRYEITYHSSYMFYQWKQLYVEGKKRIKTVYTYLFRALKIHNKKIIPKTGFFIKSRFDNWKQYQKRDGVKWPQNFRGDKQVTFTFDLFNKLYDEFWNNIKSVQIKTSSNVSVPILKKRIDEYNAQENCKIALSTCRKPKFKNTGRLLFYFEISQRISLKIYMRKGMISQRQYERIIKVFKRLGLADYNPVVNLATPAVGYADYKYYFGHYVYNG